MIATFQQPYFQIFVLDTVLLNIDANLLEILNGVLIFFKPIRNL